MNRAEAGGEGPWTQRRVSARGTTLLLPRVLLGAALADLAWEIVKANLDSPVREEWPWRLVLLDASTCAALVALLTGILVTRSQLSQTMRPVLTWSGFEGHSTQLPDSRRTVTLANHGGGRAVVRSVAYRIRPTAADGEDEPSGGGGLADLAPGRRRARRARARRTPAPPAPPDPTTTATPPCSGPR